MILAIEAKKYAISEIRKYGSEKAVTLFEVAERKALELAENLDADIELTKAGFWLMDLKLPQAIAEERILDHIEMSMDEAKEFLKQFPDIGIEANQKLMNCIEAHHGDTEFTCLEAEVCTNADCYKFLHPKGIFIYLTLLGERSNDFNQSLKFIENKLDEKWNMLSLDICKQELTPYYKVFKQLFSEARNL